MSVSFENELFQCTYVKSLNQANTIYDTHCHSFLELLMVTKGNVQIILEDKRYFIPLGSLAVISPLAYHSILAEEQTEYERITVLFRSNPVPEEIQEICMQQIKICPFLTGQSISKIVEAFKDALVKENNAVYAPLLQSYLIQMFYLLADRETEEFNESIQFSTDKNLRLILSYINENLSEKLTVEDIAAHVFLSKSTVCHLFRQKMRIGIKQYILQKKMTYAQQLINNGSSASEAAKAIGYLNYANFFIIYKKMLCESPSENRRKSAARK